MKVDTNTRGNTYWFNFKVSNFIIGKRYTFNVFNFTRNLDKFYQAGMNVMTMAEEAAGSGGGTGEQSKGSGVESCRQQVREERS